MQTEAAGRKGRSAESSRFPAACRRTRVLLAVRWDSRNLRFLSGFVRFAIAFWSVFTAARYLFSGRTWVWTLADSIPPDMLILAPACLLVASWSIRARRARWATLCIASLLAGLPHTDAGRMVFEGENCASSAAAHRRTTVLSWNTQFWGEKSPGLDLIGAVESVKADIVALQEVHLAANDIIVDLPFPAPPASSYKNIRQKGELVILSNLDVLSDNTQDAGETFLRADLELPGGTVVRVINVHVSLHISLSLNPVEWDFFDFIAARYEMRGREFDEISRAVRESPYPTVLLGDFNSTVMMARLRKVMAGLCDSIFASERGGWHTWGLGGYYLWRPDYVFLSQSLNLLEHRVMPMKGISDHAGVLVELSPRPAPLRISAAP